VRWSFFARRAPSADTCTLCGGELVTERRRPGRDRRRTKDLGDADRREQMDRREAQVTPVV
jgi:hypothetical protein